MIISREINGQNIEIELLPEELVEAEIESSIIRARKYIEKVFKDEDLNGITKSELLADTNLLRQVGKGITQYRYDEGIGHIIYTIIPILLDNKNENNKTVLDLKLCPQCKEVVSYNPYFQRYLCNECGWESAE